MHGMHRLRYHQAPPLQCWSCTAVAACKMLPKPVAKLLHAPLGGAPALDLLIEAHAAEQACSGGGRLPCEGAPVLHRQAHGHMGTCTCTSHPHPPFPPPRPCVRTRSGRARPLHERHAQCGGHQRRGVHRHQPARVKGLIGPQAPLAPHDRAALVSSLHGPLSRWTVVKVAGRPARACTHTRTRMQGYPVYAYTLSGHTCRMNVCALAVRWWPWATCVLAGHSMHSPLLRVALAACSAATGLHDVCSCHRPTWHIQSQCTCMAARTILAWHAPQRTCMVCITMYLHGSQNNPRIAARTILAWHAPQRTCMAARTILAWQPEQSLHGLHHSAAPPASNAAAVRCSYCPQVRGQSDTAAWPHPPLQPGLSASVPVRALWPLAHTHLPLAQTHLMPC